MRNLAKYTTVSSQYRMAVCKHIFTNAYIKGSICVNQHARSWTVDAVSGLIISHMPHGQCVTFYMKHGAVLLTVHTPHMETDHCYSIEDLLRELLALEREKMKPKPLCYIL